MSSVVSHFSMIYKVAPSVNLSLARPIFNQWSQFLDRSCSNCPQSVSRVVFISQSSDVFTNLALEDWFYRNWSFEKCHALLLWRNQPCIVIGRHQNPYVEADASYLETSKIPLARRNSGGGAVFHDAGNLNCTFFTTRKRYNRKENLNTICKALLEDFQVVANVNNRDDIIVDGKKVSGTAAKLGRIVAYHHCTLLVDVNKLHLKSLFRGDKTMTSKATASVPNHVLNMKEINSSMTVDNLLVSIGQKYLEEMALHSSNGFTLLNPTDEWFPGLAELRRSFTSWSWLYGTTPRFTVSRCIHLPKSLSQQSDLSNKVNVHVSVYHGIIENVIFVDDNDSDLSCRSSVFGDVNEDMKGSQYTSDLIQIIHDKLNHLHQQITKFNNH